MYSTQIGRFTSEDPSGLRQGESNLYRYVGNNPVNQVDPSGLEAYLYSNGPSSHTDAVMTVLRRLFGEANVGFVDSRATGLTRVTLRSAGTTLEPSLFGLITLFKLDPKDRLVQATASAAAAIEKHHWEEHIDSVARILSAIDRSGPDVLVHLSESGQFTVTPFRPHPSSQILAEKGFQFAIGSGLPSGGVVINNSQEKVSLATSRSIEGGALRSIEFGVEYAAESAVGAVFLKLLGRLAGAIRGRLKFNIGGEGELAAKGYIDAATEPQWVHGLHVERQLTSRFSSGSVSRVFMRNIAPSSNNNIASEVARLARSGTNVEILTTVEAVDDAKSALTAAFDDRGLRILDDSIFRVNQQDAFDMALRTLEPGTDRKIVEQVADGFLNGEIRRLLLQVGDRPPIEALLIPVARHAFEMSTGNE